MLAIYRGKICHFVRWDAQGFAQLHFKRGGRHVRTVYAKRENVILESDANWFENYSQLGARSNSVSSELLALEI